MEQNNKKKEMGRRKFLKLLGAGAAATSAAIYGCKPGEGGAAGGSATEGEAAGSMTFRTNPTSGDKVSLLGFGMMRLPFVERKREIDQEMVNEMVDYAMAHGVNYFDTSPAYCQGLSERATGVALSRHPRDSYFVATKLSNFGNFSREASMEMYHQSFKELQVDHIDYYLLHSVGGGDGMGLLNARFFDNGMVDFLVKEREAGRIRNLGFSYHGDIRVFDYLLSRHDEFKWDFVQIQMNYLDWKFAKQINRSNTNAEYLYGELAKRNIPAIIMEPLLGGRLSNVPDNIVARLKQREPGQSVASWAFRFAGSYPGVLTVLSGMTRMEHLRENVQTYFPLKVLTESQIQLLLDPASLMMPADGLTNSCSQPGTYSVRAMVTV